jgi:Ca2+-transporting ATPase
MRLPPRKTSRSLFNSNEMIISIVQGLIIAAGVLILYHISMERYSLEETRTLVFTSLLFSNIFLTFTNRSFTENLTKTMKYHNPLAPVIIATSLVFIAIILFVPAIRTLFGLAAISPLLFFLCLVTGFVSVAWFEVYKTNLPAAG